MTRNQIERAIVKNLNKPVEESNYEFFDVTIDLIRSKASLKYLEVYIPSMCKRMMEIDEYLGYDV